MIVPYNKPRIGRTLGLLRDGLTRLGGVWLGSQVGESLFDQDGYSIGPRMAGLRCGYM